MKLVIRIFAVLFVLLVVLAGAQYVASESGEVVVLTTTDADGTPHETRLWIVDYEGNAWLRAGADVQAWYGRLLEQPEVEVERDGKRKSYTAVPEPDVRRILNEHMSKKYGWADAFIGLLFGRDDTIPIRLEPR